MKKTVFISVLIIVMGLIGLFSFQTAMEEVSDFPGGFEAETNFYKYKQVREEIIKRMKEGKIKKEDLYNTGFAFYYTPPQYKEANLNDTIEARMYGDRNFIFFQSYDNNDSFFPSGPGIIEGFLYSSTGKPPRNNTEFHTIGEYQRIDDHWFFVTDR
jgi:hypothetical protein